MEEGAYETNGPLSLPGAPYMRPVAHFFYLLRSQTARISVPTKDGSLGDFSMYELGPRQAVEMEWH